LMSCSCLSHLHSPVLTAPWYIASHNSGIWNMFSATVTILLPITPYLSMIGLKKDAKEAVQKDKEWLYKVSLVLTVIVHLVKGNMLVKLHAQCSWG
jgi:hypothetical protein